MIKVSLDKDGNLTWIQAAFHDFVFSVIFLKREKLLYHYQDKLIGSRKKASIFGFHFSDVIPFLATHSNNVPSSAWIHKVICKILLRFTSRYEILNTFRNIQKICFHTSHDENKKASLIWTLLMLIPSIKRKWKNISVFICYLLCKHLSFWVQTQLLLARIREEIQEFFRRISFLTSEQPSGRNKNRLWSNGKSRWRPHPEAI